MFTADLTPLLASTATFDFDDALDFVVECYVPHSERGNPGCRPGLSAVFHRWFHADNLIRDIG